MFFYKKKYFGKTFLSREMQVFRLDLEPDTFHAV